MRILLLLCMFFMGTKLHAATIIGEKKLLVILVRFQDSGADEQTVDQVNAVVNQFSQFINENSYGKASISPTVYGRYTIPLNQASCDYSKVQTLANQALAADGKSTSGFNYLFYSYPSISANGADICHGSSSLGGSTTYHKGVLTVGGFAHDVGHNFGLYHSHFLDCDSVLTGNCVQVEYGDKACPMALDVRHYNTFQKERLGWLSTSGAAPSIQIAGSTGDYNLSPYALLDNKIKSLKIPKGIDSKSGKMNYYYVEYRQPIGFDVNLDHPFSFTDNLLTGVIIRLGTDGSPDSSFQLDMTPGSKSSASNDAYDGALDVGKVYNDQEAKISIALVSADSSGAIVRVNFNGTNTTDTTAPTVNLMSPIADATLSGTIALSASASDNAAVGQVLFSVDGIQVGADASSPYSIDFNTANLSNGLHVFSAQAVDTAGNKSLASQVPAYISNVSVPTDTLAPSVSIDSPADGSIVRSRSTLNVAGHASDDTGVTRVEVYANGSLKCSIATSSAYSCSLRVPGGKNNSITVEARAYDAAGNIGRKSISLAISK